MQVINPGVKLLAIHPMASNTVDDFQFVTYCARVSHNGSKREIKSPEESKKFVSKIAYKMKHQSILEHLWKTFKLEYRGGASNHYSMHNYYLSLLELFNEADVLGNITYINDTIYISANPRMLYLMHRHILKKIARLIPITVSDVIIYRIIKMFGPIISDYADFSKTDIEAIDQSYGSTYLPNIYPVTHAELLEELKKRHGLFGFDIFQRHIFYTFEIVADRATHLEHVRHRFRSGYTAESTRYRNYQEGITIVNPEEIQNSAAEVWDLYLDIHKEIEEVYNKIINLTPESRNKKYFARAVLSNSTAVGYVYTTNLKQLLTNFLPLRYSESAQPTIRVIAGQIKYAVENNVEPVL